jgi:hypothetical protein
MSVSLHQCLLLWIEQEKSRALQFAVAAFIVLPGQFQINKISAAHFMAAYQTCS